MTRWKLLVVVVSLLTNLLPAVAMAPEGNLSLQVQWRLQKADDLPYVLPRVEEPEYKVLKPQNGETAPKDDQKPAPREGAVSPEAKSPSQADTPCQQPESKKPWGVQTWATVVTAAFTGVLAFVTIFQVCIYRRQADIMGTQAGLMEEQADLMGQGLKLTRESNKAAQVAADAAKVSADAAITNAKAAVIAQRAYINVSPHPPGLDYDERGWFWVGLKVTNSGETSAGITDIVIQWVVGEMPEAPITKSMEEESPPSGLLIRNEWMYCETRSPSPINVNIADILEGKLNCFVYGHVDYIDMFRQRHRFGFVRKYEYRVSDNRRDYKTDEAFMERNNLRLMFAPEFSYDRLRKPGEGNDWGT